MKGFQLIMAIRLLLSTFALAQGPVSKNRFTDVAIGGHDSVGYHTSNQAMSKQQIKGNKDFSYTWNDAKWLFATEADRDKFAASPETYIPEFNGHCANALSLNEGLIKTNGKVWSFFGDKLYLFYAKRGLDRWNRGNFEEYLVIAEQEWLRLK